MYDCAVVASADKFTDTVGRHLGVFLCQIDNDLSGSDKFTFAAPAEDIAFADAIVFADNLNDVVEREGAVVDFHRAFEHALGKLHVDVAVVNDGIALQGCYDPLKVADASVGSLCNELNNVIFHGDAFPVGDAVENVDAKLRVGLFKFCNQSAGKASEQAFVHSFQFHWWPVGGEDDALSISEKMVEDVEHAVLRFRGCEQELHIIDDEDVDGLIEINEVVLFVLQAGIAELHLEDAGADI